MTLQKIEIRMEPGQWIGVKLPLSISLIAPLLEALSGEDYEHLKADAALWRLVWPESAGACLIVTYPGAGKRLCDAEGEVAP